jgi:beta-aspartyl-peptidase (threonine type)
MTLSVSAPATVASDLATPSGESEGDESPTPSLQPPAPGTEDRSKFINDKTGTVGCVCMLNGHVAAATSTGGMTNKACGRIGDSPIIGAGTFADDRTCAVSCTGVGEIFQRFVAAYDISARMEYKKDNLVEAVRGTVYKRLPHDTGGVIAVDHYGNHAMEFNTTGMFRGMVNSLGHACVGIWAEEDYFDLHKVCLL